MSQEVVPIGQGVLSLKERLSQIECTLFLLFEDVALSTVTHKLKLFSHFECVNAQIFAATQNLPVNKRFCSVKTSEIVRIIHFRY